MPLGLGIFSGTSGAANTWVRYTASPTATAGALGALCGWTCDQGTACATTCATNPIWVTLANQTVATTATVTSCASGTVLWSAWFEADDCANDPQSAPVRRQPTDQELYQRAVAEHDEQEAERLRRVIAARERHEAEQRRIAEEARQRHAAEVARRAEAAVRAKELLFEHLTPAQRKTFEKNGWFVVEGGKSKQQYRIHIHSAAGNVMVMDGKRGIARLCCHCDTGAIPLSDQLLAQKLMLEFAEDDFLRLANRTAA